MEPKSLLDAAEIRFFEQMQSLIGCSSKKKANLPRTINTVCGVDAAYSREGNRVTAVATLLTDGKLEETSTYSGRFTFPYASGLFFLHEGPFVVAAVRGLKKIPQLVCFDAQGMAHPRMKGLATTCGMVLGLSTIGIAKSKLIGRAIPYRNGLMKIQYEGRSVGLVTSEPKRYWSPGYSVSMAGLGRIIFENRNICLKSLERAHAIAKNSIQES